jgi:hypothetical protein
MFEEFDARSQTTIVRDAAGVARALSHASRYVLTEAPTPQAAARAYLDRYGELLGLQQDQLQRLSLPPEQDLSGGGIEFRLSSEKHQFDLVTVTFYQTYFGLPVWEAGLSITMKDKPFRVVGAQTTRHPDLELKRPSAQAIARSRKLDPATIAKSLGFASGPPDDSSFNVDRQRLMIFRYERAKRTRTSGKPPKDAGVFQTDDPGLPLPPVDSSIQEGRHYVVDAVYFRLDVLPFRPLNWVALIEIETLSVLLLRPFVDNVTGMVFCADPITTAGPNGPLANANNATLNPLRQSVTLDGLAPPVNGTQALSGSNVILSEIETPTVAAPTNSTGTSFDYDVRTNDFAAVNAYYHCDRFFRVLEDLGFPGSSYLTGTALPSPVDHRGHKSDPNGIEINAHCVGNTGGNGIGYTSFMLADLTDTDHPVGLACDRRVALHELCGHGVLYNHVNSANFGFSHSAGDSFAVILSDPGSQATDRFLSFPWTPAGRRHDRPVAGGWGWGGNIAQHPFDNTLDYKGYNNEQILSTTMFRVYRSIGGDAASIDMQRFAARMTCHLMLAAIGGLNPAHNPHCAADFAQTLSDVDAGDWPSEGVSGGAYRKVIRWAFEKQGLYQPPGSVLPNDNIGAPPPVDVYIEDGRHGEYDYQPNHWSCQAIWNRRHNDGGAMHEEPVVGVTNYAYVKIKNRGSDTATNVVVRAFHCQPAAGLIYPDDWQPMTTAQLAAADVPPNSQAEVLVGPFEWVPSQIGHECMFMVASAPSDASNIDNLTANESIPEWRLVPNDNNIGQRNVHPVAAGNFAGFVRAFRQMRFQLKNPFNKRARMTLKAALPSFLADRDWRIAFRNPGANAFTREPGGGREMVWGLVPGHKFSIDEVYQAKNRAIHIEAYADGILVGGMSYPVEVAKKLGRKLKKPRAVVKKGATRKLGASSRSSTGRKNVRRP